MSHGLTRAGSALALVGDLLAVSASRCAAAPVTVSARGIRRRGREVENAVYFTCPAAIDNAAKHAGPAEISVHVWDTPRALQFTVCDTGCGFDLGRTPTGAGLKDMRDRITAFGGTLTVDSRLAHGTRLYPVLWWPKTFRVTHTIGDSPSVSQFRPSNT